MSDGALYTYLTGNEYEDIQGAWDWQLIPGTTVDYNATALVCGQVGFAGKQTFVGGVSDGNVGIGVMRYTNPKTGSLQFQKTYFFVDGNVLRVSSTR